MVFRKEGHDVQVRVTYEDGDSDRFVGEALEAKSYDVIVAAGGDGSVNEVRNVQLEGSDAHGQVLSPCIHFQLLNDT